MKKLLLWLSGLLKNLAEPGAVHGIRGELLIGARGYSGIEPGGYSGSGYTGIKKHKVKKCKSCKTSLPEKPCTAKLSDKVSFIYYRCRKCGKYTKFKI